MEINDRLAKIEKEIKGICQRNKKVEGDKAWETSWFRRIVIFTITYIIAAIWLVSIHDTNPLLKAFVPALGWVLSMMSLPFVKKWWIKRHK